ncbi:MAG: protein-glutamate O-methyltransferase CheR [Sulfuricurvum sp.]|nr:protein-glutamate O-methyltransferase CheR [Sulfuricurvum sp.]MDP3464641.1 protein-glutamate O-methyltransferase CheR [Sulfuricurvum sp.]
MVEIELSPEEFELFRRYIYDKVGIALSEQKSTLIKGRLNKRVNQLGLRTFREYYNYLVADESGDELALFVSAISTNVTSFFRESAQWVWLEGYLPQLIAAKRDKKLRIWSAGCSSGEEPYTILMFLQHHLSDFESWDIKILATDISPKVLAKAIVGSYEAKAVESLPREITLRSFEKVRSDTGISYQVVPHLREKVLFRLYNLVTDPFFFKNRFDMIFCRNVMIYFDEPTRHDLIGRFGTLLPRGAPLFLGSSESLTTHRETLKLLGSSIYQRL